jgi:RNA polymerase sigma-70 factor (ECF subfamily)
MGPPGRDESWFTDVYGAHHDDVVNYLRRRLSDLDAVAELSQDVFVVAWRRRADVPDRSLPWLYGVARRLLANRWRSGRAAPRLEPMPDGEQLADRRRSRPEEAAVLADVRAALARVPELDQEILRLVGWEELTVGEAAQVLGCTRTAAAVRLHRARRRLSAALSPSAAAPASRPAAAPTRPPSPAAAPAADRP